MDLFASVRDKWMEEDLAGWISANRLYPNLAQALKGAMERHEVYIVTTKQVTSGIGSATNIKRVFIWCIQLLGAHCEPLASCTVVSGQ